MHLETVWAACHMGVIVSINERKGLGMEPRNRIFDDIAKLATNAAGLAQGVKDEAETLFRSRAERMLAGMDLVTREEFDAVAAMAALAREENERLSARLEKLEAQLAKAAPKARTAAKKPAAKKPAAKKSTGSTN